MLFLLSNDSQQSSIYWLLHMSSIERELKFSPWICVGGPIRSKGKPTHFSINAFLSTKIRRFSFDLVSPPTHIHGQIWVRVLYYSHVVRSHGRPDYPNRNTISAMNSSNDIWTIDGRWSGDLWLDNVLPWNGCWLYLNDLNKGIWSTQDIYQTVSNRACHAHFFHYSRLHVFFSRRFIRIGK